MTDLAYQARYKGVNYVLITFIDLYGTQRAKLVPMSVLQDMGRAGATFAGNTTWLDLSAAHGDLTAIPDSQSFMMLPWQREVGWVSADLHMDGLPLSQCPRGLLKTQIEKAAQLGYEPKTGIEPEFFLLKQHGDGISDGNDTQQKPCYDLISLMRQFPLVRSLLDAMEVLGWGPIQAGHEDANGQLEINWTHANALVTADRHAFFKVMVKALAETHGTRVSFVPKPFGELTGSSCFTHISLWSKQAIGGESKNLFSDPKGPCGLSTLAYQFIAGLMQHAPAICAITNPSVNSYRRLAGGATASGTASTPTSISYSSNNRTHLVRIPDHQRIEFRLPDSSAHPYLLQAAVLAAGLDGITRNLDPGIARSNDNSADPLPLDQAKQLPSDLGEALDAFAADTILRAALGEDFCRSYEKIRRQYLNRERGITGDP